MSVIVVVESADGLSRELVMPAAPSSGDIVVIDGQRRFVLVREFARGMDGEMRLTLRVSSSTRDA